MGLDMYLTGNKFFWTNWEHPEKNRKEDGIKVSSLNVELGYWRKHPNLHGYIVQTFANGKDECQNIELWSEDLKKIINVVKDGNLPHTEGFFFGVSRNDAKEIENDIKQLKNALDWLEVKEEGVVRSVIYRAIW